MTILNADALLEGIPFLYKRSRASLPSIRSNEWTTHSISLAAKVAVCALVCTNLVQLLLLSAQSGSPCESDPRPPAQKAVAAASDMHVAEVLLANLPEVVRQAIGAPMPFPDRHFAVFVIFSWNFPLFWTSLQTYMAAGWGRRVIILDNSPDHRILHDPLVGQMVGEIIPTRVQLTFSQCQNYIADISAERNYTYHFWGHADVALHASSPQQTFAEEVLDCMDQVDAANPKWGITYFHYDWFAATRHAVARDLRYDTFITVYMSDCDYYPRVRQAGFETLDAASVCSVVPSVYDMRSHKDLPLDDYAKTGEALEGIKISEWDRNSWKYKAWGLGEQIGWELWELTTQQYFRYKWGLQKDGAPHECKIEVEGPDGQKALRQEPFETLADLYVPLSRTSDRDINVNEGPGKVPATADERRRRLRMV